jgi:hypothetical protein
MIPFIDAVGDVSTAQKLRKRLSDNPVPTTIYYGQTLALFAQGSLDGLYHFSRDGSLIPRWTQSCASPQKR